jgi:hypothetical protein
VISRQPQKVFNQSSVDTWRHKGVNDRLQSMHESVNWWITDYLEFALTQNRSIDFCERESRTRKETKCSLYSSFFWPRSFWFCGAHPWARKFVPIPNHAKKRCDFKSVPHSFPSKELFTLCAFVVVVGNNCATEQFRVGSIAAMPLARGSEVLARKGV